MESGWKRKNRTYSNRTYSSPSPWQKGDISPHDLPMVSLHPHSSHPPMSQRPGIGLERLHGAAVGQAEHLLPGGKMLDFALQKLGSYDVTHNVTSRPKMWMEPTEFRIPIAQLAIWPLKQRLWHEARIGNLYSIPGKYSEYIYMYQGYSNPL